ncbi:MAG TPA: hypothetical protein VJ867_09400 [Gemmatimonadaceae bacterium]|nr:hypothetical protein [Gemmatimonadaceae bacterium]
MKLDPKLTIAAANAFVGMREEGGDNRGQMVEMFLREVRQPPGEPWCAAFVHHVGYWSHFDASVRASSWPLPATASCAELGKYALVRRILVKDAQPGDVFLLFSKVLGRFHHAGIVVSVDARYPVIGPGTPDTDGLWVCTTVEGNTNDDGSVNGNATLRKVRRINTLNGDRFVRWVELEQLRAA